MTIVTIDIETVPDEDKVELFKELVHPDSELVKKWNGLDADLYDIEYPRWRAKEMSLTPEFCRIVGMNYMVLDLEPVSHWVGEDVNSHTIPGKVLKISEVGLLRGFWKLAKEHRTIVTFNGLAFDLEVIKFRSAVHNIDANGVDLTNLKPWENRVIDLMKRLYSNRKAMGLKKLRQILWSQLVDIDPHLLHYEDILEMEGSSVYELFQAGNFELLKHYGEFDAASNMAIFRWGRGFWW